MGLWLGITWLDQVMAVVTVVGFVATIWTAIRAANAAAAAKKAISETESRLAQADLLSSFNLIKEAFRDVGAAEDSGNLEVAKHALVKLNGHLNHCAALAESKAVTVVPDDEIIVMREIALACSEVKAKLAKIPRAKVSNHTGELTPKVELLIQRFSSFEVQLRYSQAGEDK